MRRKKSVFAVMIMALLILFSPFIHRDTAMAAANVNDSAELKAAIEAGETEITIGSNFTLSESIKIENKTIVINGGGFTITNANENMLQMFDIKNSTVTFNNIILDGNKKSSIIWATKDSNITLDNSTVKNGISKTDISGGLPNGGGIYSFDSNLTIKNETNFLDNKSAEGGQGGAIFFGGDETKSLTVTNSTFTGNACYAASAPHNTGGAIHFQNKLELGGGEPTLTVTNTTFNIGKPFNTGGGIRTLGGVATVTGCTFNINNLGDAYGVSGGGICAENTNLTVSWGTFISTGSGKVTFAGGFIDIVGSDAEKNKTIIKDSKFTGEKPPYDMNNPLANGYEIASFGGAIAYETGIAGTHLIEECTFENLSSSDTGGAISIGTRKNELIYPNELGTNYEPSSANVTIKKSTITNTQTLAWGEAQGGGAIYVGPGNTLTLDETKISNGLSYEGGLIYNAGTTLITSETSIASSITGGVALKLGGSIYNNGKLTVDKGLVYGSFVGDALLHVNPHPDKKGEYGGVNIYAEKDVIITPKASFSSVNATKDIRVIDGQSKIILTGSPTTFFNVSINEVEQNEGNFPEKAYRKVGYVVASGDGTYEPTAEDAKKIHYLSKDELSTNPLINKTIAKWSDHTSIGKWDYVLDPVSKNIVLGQRVKLAYYPNGGTFGTEPDIFEKTYEVYSGITPYTNPVQFIPADEEPTRERYSFIGWYINANHGEDKDLGALDGEDIFYHEKHHFVKEDGEITSVLNPNIKNVYAGWTPNINVEATKLWEDKGGEPLSEDKKSEIVLVLENSSNTNTITRTANADNDWKVKFGEEPELLKKYGVVWNETSGKYDGIEIVYTLSEFAIEGFTTIITGNDKEGFIVTNREGGFLVTHTFVSGTEGKELPQSVLNLLPANQENLADGAEVTPTYLTTTEVEVVDGTWTFQVWNPTEAVIDGADVNFIGTWIFTPTYTITHKFTGGTEENPLPAGVMDQLPEDITGKKKDDVVTPGKLKADFTDVPTTEGAWSFVSWDKESVTITDKDEEFIGTWKFTKKEDPTPVDINVTYEFVDKNGGELPKEVIDQLPQNITVSTETEISPDIPKNIAVPEGEWKFISWNPERKVVVDDTNFLGTWEFVKKDAPIPNKYKVDYDFESITPSKILPKEVWDKLPRIHLEKSGTVITPIAIGNVVVADGTWVFVGWEPLSQKIVDRDIKFIGKWRFVEAIKPEPKPTPAPELSPSVIDFIFSPMPVFDHGLLNKQDHWAYMFGYPDMTFQPEGNMTRAEATAMFARLLKDYPDGYRTYNINFPDVKEGDWYYEAIGFMVEKNIIEGYEDGTFKPNSPISRAEFATMASRFDKLSSSNSQRFSDVLESHWAYKFIDSAATKGWVGGYPDGTFEPDKNITRAEVVTITNRMLNRKADEGFVIENKVLLLDFKDLRESHWAYFNIMEATHGHDFERLANGIDEDWIKLNGLEFRFAVVGYN